MIWKRWPFIYHKSCNVSYTFGQTNWIESCSLRCWCCYKRKLNIRNKQKKTKKKTKKQKNRFSAMKYAPHWDIAILRKQYSYTYYIQHLYKYAYIWFDFFLLCFSFQFLFVFFFLPTKEIIWCPLIEYMQWSVGL